MDETLTKSLFDEPIFSPTFLNLEFIFEQILRFIRWLINTIFSLGGGTESLNIMLVKYILWIVSLAFLIGIVYALFEHQKIKNKQKTKFEEMQLKEIEKASQVEKNDQWERVLDLIDSHNESDWKLAIMEADTMLGRSLDKMGYQGETIGEQLKIIEQSDFSTLSQAWEAHKVRNKIAHEGMDFRISQHEARRVVNLFEEVFKEFHYI